MNKIYVKGHYSDWRTATKEEALVIAENFFRDFPDKQSNEKIFKRHIKGISYEEFLENRQ